MQIEKLNVLVSFFCRKTQNCWAFIFDLNIQQNVPDCEALM